MTQYKRPQFRPPEPESEVAERNISFYVVDRLLPPGVRFWPAVIIFGILFFIGVIAFGIRLSTSGLAQRAGWGYLMATLAYLLTTVQAAPVVAIGLRFLKADWRRHFSRVSELFAVAGILGLLIYIPMLLALPPTSGRHSLWINWTFGVPWLFDTLAISGTVLLGIVFLWTSAVPDFATIRDMNPNRERRFYAFLSLGWRGTERQWAIHRRGLAFLGAFYLLIFGLTNLLISVDFAQSLIPGWESSIFPSYQFIGALEAAVAISIVAIFLWRRFGGLEPFIRVDHFHGLGTILFALALLWFYFWWSDFITLWYGKTPREQLLLQLFAFGSYFIPWILTLGLCFVVPLLVLLWNQARSSIIFPTLVAVGVLIGSFFDRVRFYVAAFSIEDVTAQQLEQVPTAQLPDILDILMIVGVLSGFSMLYLVGSKVVSPLAIWEVKDGIFLRLYRRILRGKYLIIGKPD